MNNLIKKTRQYSWPENHWGWPVALTHQHGVRAGNFVFTGGQADLDAQGNVQHPHDVERQVSSVTKYMLAVLADLDCDARDLVRLVIYFVGDAQAEASILEQIANLIGPDSQPVVNTIPVPQLCYPGMVIELEGVAMCAVGSKPLARKNIRLNSLSALHAGFSHVVKCNDVVFTSDISAIAPDGSMNEAGNVVAQTSIMMEQLGTALAAAGASFNDVLKLNVFYVGDGTAENWEKPALIRQAYFNDPGPAATGITLPTFAQAGQMTKIAVTADGRTNTGNAQSTPERQFSWPQGHWNWTTKLPYKHGNRSGNLIHLGGQVSLNSQAQVIDPDDIVAQTTRAMAYIKNVLAELGATLDHVVKVTTFYVGESDADALHQNLLVRSGAFSKPGPATSGIPVPSLVYENMRVEIEVIAVLD